MFPFLCVVHLFTYTEHVCTVINTVIILPSYGSSVLICISSVFLSPCPPQLFHLNLPGFLPRQNVQHRCNRPISIPELFILFCSFLISVWVSTYSVILSLIRLSFCDCRLSARIHFFATCVAISFVHCIVLYGIWRHSFAYTSTKLYAHQHTCIPIHRHTVCGL